MLDQLDLDELINMAYRRQPNLTLGAYVSLLQDQLHGLERVAQWAEKAGSCFFPDFSFL